MKVSEFSECGDEADVGSPVGRERTEGFTQHWQVGQTAVLLMR